MITFDPLWRTLATRRMNKTDLQKVTGLSSATIAKLSKSEVANAVMLDVVDRIATALEIPIYDVVEVVSNTTKKAVYRTKKTNSAFT